MKNINYTENQLALENKRNINKYTKNSDTDILTKINCNCIVYLFNYTSSVNEYRAVIFEGRRTKASFYYGFTTEEKRTKYLNSFFEKKEKIHQYKIEKSNAKKKRKIDLAKEIEIGTVLQGSWGYEQTNREFYQVVEKPSKFKVVIRPISQENVPGSMDFNSCKVKPIKDSFIGDKETKIITEYGVKVHRSCNVKPCNINGEYYKSWGY